jgi:hypothetical protein
MPYVGEENDIALRTMLIQVGEDDENITTPQAHNHYKDQLHKLIHVT